MFLYNKKNKSQNFYLVYASLLMKRKRCRMGTGAIIGICLMLIVRFGFKVSFALPCLSHQETIEDIPVT